MKKLISIFVILFLCSVSNAQTWIPLGSGINGYVNTLFVYDSVMYVGGSFTSPGNNIAEWNGTIWNSLGSGINNEVNAITPYKGQIYVGGWFTKAGGYSAGSIAKWNGAGFTNAGFDIEGGSVEALQTYDSLLYIGGLAFDSINHNYLSTQGIASWNGLVIHPVSNSDTFYTENYSFSVFDGNLFTGEEIYGAYDYCLLYWNNLYYSCSADYFHSNGYGYQYAMAVCNASLYIGGLFDSAGSIPVNNIVAWNGVSCSKLGSGINGPVYALATYNNLLFAGGSFDSAGGIAVNNIAMWNGTTWFAIGTGLNGPVYALAIFDSNLYAGGNFNSPGIGVAEFTGVLGINELANNYTVNIYPNPTNEKFIVSWSAEQNQQSHPKIEIYNILGEKIYSSTLLANVNSINLEKQPAGVYLYRISLPNGNLISSGKIIIE